MHWEWYDTSHMVHFFLHCLLKANHKSGKWRGVDVEEGQFITSLSHLSKEIGISEQVARSCIKRLKSTGEITSTSTSKYTIITVCNYKLYNSDEETINTQNNTHQNKRATSNQQAINKQLTTNNNDKNNKNDNNEKNRDNTRAPEIPIPDSELVTPEPITEPTVYKRTKPKREPFIPPDIEEVKAFFKENGYAEETAITAFKYYEDGNWKDSTGKPVISWKQKMRAVWFKNDNNRQNKQPIPEGTNENNIKFFKAKNAKYWAYGEEENV